MALELPTITLPALVPADPQVVFVAFAACWLLACYWLLVGGRAQRVEVRRRASFGAAVAASSGACCAGFASGAPAVAAPSSAHAGNDTVPPVSSPPSAVTISFFLNIDESSCLIG